MMKNKFRIGLLSMAAVGLVGCADKLTDDVAQTQGDEAENYVVFKIGSIGSETRATPGNGDFHEGLAEEHAVSTKAGVNFVYFFDENGNAASDDSSIPLEVLGQIESDDAYHNDHNSSYDSDAQEKIYQARIKGTKEELKKYKQCLVILNGAPEQLVRMKNKPLNGILEELNKDMGWLTDGGTKYFTMSNTVYADGSEVKSATTVYPDKQICTTMAEAQANPIVVHVERVLAKFELNNKVDGNTTTLITKETEIEPTPNAADDDKNLYITLMTSTKEPEEDSATEGTTGDNGTVGNDGSESPDHYTEWVSTKHKWKVKIVGWGMNATESATYWVKNLKFDDSVQFGEWKPEYDGDLNTIGWNDKARLRSYWAVDPHYNKEASDKYPHQYRDAFDNDKIVPGNDGSNTNKVKNGFVLNYNTYNDFAPNKFPTNGYHYTVENTFDYPWFTEGTKYDFKGYDYKRTSTHAIVAAELLIADQEGDAPTSYSAKTVYQYDSYYWLADAAKAEYKDMPESLKKYMLNQILFHWALENDYKELCTDDKCTNPLVASSKNFDEYFEVVAATVEGGDGRAMMKLQSGKYLYFMDKDGKIVSIANASGNLYIDDFNKEYLYQYGTARRFDGGKMYYYIPIKHMSADNSASTAADYEYNVGKWGVVRNHWYRLNINAIKNPGIPVDNPGQPIIPNDDPDQDYYAAFEIVILPWHVIDNNVTFE